MATSTWLYNTGIMYRISISDLVLWVLEVEPKNGFFSHHQVLNSFEKHQKNKLK
jgi:hypothetical protein